MNTKAMEQMSDFEFAAGVLQARLNMMENPDTPMANRLRSAIHRLRQQDIMSKLRKKSWWEITFTDPDGNTVMSRNMPEIELERIGALVADGYYQGQIDFDADESEEYTT